jgi:hypothetical protein
MKRAKGIVTLRQLASRIPKPDGTSGVHDETVRRAIKRGEIPPTNFNMGRTQAWVGELLEHPAIAPFVEQTEAQ